ncbi:MAG: universal stress protein [Betaproteobacteria bacterium]|nr:universal stress protein [Betaproteobacteria bacterium]MDH3437770.1 universal stress protein [Betaproteobacteria bacterium]
MYKQILIAVDGSETSRSALDDALKLAREQGAKVLLLYVYEPIVSSSTHGLVDLTQAIRDEGDQIVAGALEEARKAGVEARSRVLDAAGRRVASAIVEEANTAGVDLIVLGTHGRRGLEHLVLGSVAEGVARRAAVPVLLIRKR